MRIHVLTLFPEVFPPVLAASILVRAQAKGLFSVDLLNPRDFTSDPHHKVDDRPYGGGAGMVMMPEPIFLAVGSIRAKDPSTRGILLTPQGDRLTQAKARDYAAQESLTLVCGHYEGVDERIRTGLGLEELSIGDYVLSGGETAALVLIDAVVRLLPGALGDARSLDEESFSGGGLEYPQYTRPPVFRGMAVPEVLRCGNHAMISAWRKAEAERRTRQRRPDLRAVSKSVDNVTRARKDRNDLQS